MRNKKKVIMGAAALGAIIGTAAAINKMREDNKSQFEKIVDQVEDWLK